MAAVSLQFTGLNEVVKGLDLNDKKVQRSIRSGLIGAGKWLLRTSQQLVPVQFGILKASGFVRDVGVSKDRPDVVVGYTAKYAIYVHENMDAAHGKAFNAKYAKEIAAHSRILKRGKNKGKVVYGAVKSGWFPRGLNQQAKFLETPMRTEREAILDIVYRGAHNSDL